MTAELRVTWRALGAASWRAVARTPLVVPVVAAAALTAATVPIMDDGYAGQVWFGVATLLACGLATTADDPAPEVAAASPYPRRVRAAGRLLVGCVVVLPVVALMVATTTVQLRSDGAPGVGMQTAALLMVGPALGFGLSAWGAGDRPAYAAPVGVVTASVALWMLPSMWSLVATPPQGAAAIGWPAVTLVCAGIVAVAWRDPGAQTRARPRRA